jgi:hypothetical protein
VTTVKIKKKGERIARTPCSFFGGADQDRTDDLLNAIQALSQLSYSPKRITLITNQIYTVNIFFRDTSV